MRTHPSLTPPLSTDTLHPSWLLSALTHPSGASPPSQNDRKSSTTRVPYPSGAPSPNLTLFSSASTGSSNPSTSPARSPFLLAASMIIFTAMYAPSSR